MLVEDVVSKPQKEVPKGWSNLGPIEVINAKLYDNKNGNSDVSSYYLVSTDTSDKGKPCILNVCDREIILPHGTTFKFYTTGYQIHETLKNEFVEFFFHTTPVTGPENTLIWDYRVVVRDWNIDGDGNISGFMAFQKAGEPLRRWRIDPSIVDTVLLSGDRFEVLRTALEKMAVEVMRTLPEKNLAELSAETAFLADLSHLMEAVTQEAERRATALPKKREDDA